MERGFLYSSDKKKKEVESKEKDESILGNIAKHGKNINGKQTRQRGILKKAIRNVSANTHELSFDIGVNVGTSSCASIDTHGNLRHEQEGLMSKEGCDVTTKSKAAVGNSIVESFDCMLPKVVANMKPIHAALVNESVLVANGNNSINKPAPNVELGLGFHGTNKREVKLLDVLWKISVHAANMSKLKARKHFKNLSLDESRSPVLDLFFDQEENSKKETTKTMEQYMSKNQADYGSRVARLKIDDKYHFELKDQFIKELQDNTFSDSDHEDANEHIEKVFEIVVLFHIPNITQDQVMLRVFPMSLTGAASRRLRNKPSGSIKAWEDLKTKFLSIFRLLEL
nr:hypothetical protein [Tanacetum cinerariifolium]